MRTGELPGSEIFPVKQMQVVDQLIRPYAADVLVEAHGPERHHLALRIGVELGELLAAKPGSTPESSDTFSSV